MDLNDLLDDNSFDQKMWQDRKTFRHYDDQCPPGSGSKNWNPFWGPFLEKSIPFYLQVSFPKLNFHYYFVPGMDESYSNKEALAEWKEDPAQGQWGEWEEFSSECSVTCGGGFQTFEKWRKCESVRPCIGMSETQGTRNCNMQSCSGLFYNFSKWVSRIRTRLNFLWFWS